MTEEKRALHGFDLSRAALVVIDMQNDFLLEDAPICCTEGVAAVASINVLARHFRACGQPVIFTQEVHRKQKVDFGLELAYEEPEHCLEDSSGVAFYKDLVPQAGDYLIQKRRYSAFFATDFDLLLRGLGVDILVLTGVATDVCVRATAQDAQQYGYRVLVPQECVAGTTQAAHQAALDNIRYIWGKVVSLDDMLAGPVLQMGKGVDNESSNL